MAANWKISVQTAIYPMGVEARSYCGYFQKAFVCHRSICHPFWFFLFFDIGWDFCPQLPPSVRGYWANSSRCTECQKWFCSASWSYKEWLLVGPCDTDTDLYADIKRMEQVVTVVISSNDLPCSTAHCLYSMSILNNSGDRTIVYNYHGIHICRLKMVTPTYIYQKAQFAHWYTIPAINGCLCCYSN